MTCNWFWGSHGCGLNSGHGGKHLCGTPDDPCSTHDGTQVRYFLSDGQWSEKVFESTGFCLGDGGRHGPCGDPENCTPDHSW